MEMIHVEYHDTVALMKLNRGTTNALNLELITELSESLKIAQDPHVHGLVVTSSNEKFFSIGYDVRELYSTSREEFSVFYHAFNQFCLDLYTLPKPTVAAITGHAIAGGCAITMCCDYRFIGEGRKLMGFNVVKLGLPLPYLVQCILLNTVGARIARDIADTGDFYSPDQLLHMGMVDSVVPSEEVIPRSLEKAQSLSVLPQKAFAMTKRDRIEKVEQQVRLHLEEKEKDFVECWSSLETKKLLREAMEKF